MAEFFITVLKLLGPVLVLFIVFWLGVYRESKSKIWESKFEAYKTVAIELHQMNHIIGQLEKDAKSRIVENEDELKIEMAKHLKTMTKIYDSEVEAIKAIAVGNLVFPKQIIILINEHKSKIMKHEEKINEAAKAGNLVNMEKFYQDFRRDFKSSLIDFEKFARLDLENKVWNYDNYLSSIVKAKWSYLKFFLFNRKPSL